MASNLGALLEKQESAFLFSAGRLLSGQHRLHKAYTESALREKLNKHALSARFYLDCEYDDSEARGALTVLGEHNALPLTAIVITIGLSFLNTLHG